MANTKKASAADPRISEDLKNTLLQNPNIKKVYFDNEGNHFFNAHQGNDGQLYSRIPKKKIYSEINGKRVPVYAEFVERAEFFKAKYAVTEYAAKEIMDSDINYTIPEYKTAKLKIA